MPAVSIGKARCPFRGCRETAPLVVECEPMGDHEWLAVAYHGNHYMSVDGCNRSDARRELSRLGSTTDGDAIMARLDDVVAAVMDKEPRNA